MRLSAWTFGTLALRTGTVLVLWFGLALAVVAQDPVGPEAPAPVAKPSPSLPQDDRWKAITALQETLTSKNERLAELAKDIEVAAGEEKSTLEGESSALQREILGVRRQLEEVATGIDLDAFGAAPTSDFDLVRELTALLQPLVEELKKATQGPRQIEQLRSDIGYWEERARMAATARANVRALLEAAPAGADTERLQRMLEDWERRRQEAQNRKTVAQSQLVRKEAERKPVLESTGDVVENFFRSRGFNLLLALAAFAVVFFGMRFATRSVLRFAAPRRAEKQTPFYFRLFYVAYQFAVTVFAVLAGVMVLFAAGDWVLLGLVFLMMLGLVWAGKQALPRVVEEARLLLNLGPVREHERVVFDGIPWRVERLNLYTRLTNPLLTGGRIRLPLRELGALHSRPCVDREPWFPCREDDWVELGDGTRGKVLTQTPEMVQLVQLGGSLVTYTTSAFLGLNPVNISANFRLSVVFGVDYRHQAICTTEIPAKMRERLETELVAAVGRENLHNLAVEFREAGASSLDYEVIADFDGDVAVRKAKLRRLIQRILVDACNEHGWVIPFTQITVHQADAAEA